MFELDGFVREAGVFYAYGFDASVSSPSGTYSVVYERLGTKGLVLKRGKILREINRSYYHASVYEYPVTLFSLPDGRECIAHCPDEYCKIEVEELETGKRLTQRDNEPRDYFHSRLQASCDGRWLLSAGWVWQPVNVARVFDLSAALGAPRKLDDPEPFEIADRWGVEVGAACFVGAETLAIASGERFDEPDKEEESRSPLQELSLGVFDLGAGSYTLLHELDEVVGNMMPFGDHVVGLYEHPKLIDLRSGGIVHRWEELASGKQQSSIIHHLDPAPPMACDTRNRRFAIAGADGITVVQLG